MKIIFILLSIILVLFSFPNSVIASPIINEVYPKPLSGENEWIEIFNDSQEIIDLTGWILMDELSVPSIIFQFENEVIKADSFITIELATSKLNNDADSVKLINSQNQVISQFIYTNSQLGMSFSSYPNEESGFINNILLTNPTKNFTNPSISEIITDDAPEAQDDNQEIPPNSPVPTPDFVETVYQNMTITEIMACPYSEDQEWIILNNEENHNINLNGWYIKDNAENKIFLPNSDIANLSSIKIYLEKNILNNSGDSIFLFNPNNILSDQFTFENCNLGISQLRTNNQENNDQNSSSIQFENTLEQKLNNKNNESSNQIESQINDNGFNESINLLQKIHNLLKIVNSHKVSVWDNSDFKSDKIIIKHKILPKKIVLSVIIGGIIISCSGLFFINISKDSLEKD